MQFFYNEGIFFIKRVQILFISISFEAKTVILPFFISLTNWLLDVILVFGPWVGLGLRRLSTSSDLSSVFYKIG